MADSVMLQQFAGLKNTVTEERLAPQELADAKNIDLDDAGQAHRRRGYTQVVSGDFHSLWSAESGKTLVVRDGALSVLYPDYTTEVLRSGIGAHRLAYVEVGPNIYFSSMTDSGVVHEDNTVSDWGAPDSEGLWLSPVVNPVYTLNPTFGTYLNAPPMATALTKYRGRIYLASENVLWATELYLYDKVDRTKNFFQFESNITALGEVSDGFYVGTEKSCYFMDGRLSEMRQIGLSYGGVLPGSMITVTAELVRPDRNMSRKAVMFMTESGLCSGLDSGVSYNMTETRMLFPQSREVAAMFRQQDGVNQYVGVTDTGGTPTSKARIGDYVDAEIRRFQGG